MSEDQEKSSLPPTGTQLKEFMRDYGPLTQGAVVLSIFLMAQALRDQLDWKIETALNKMISDIKDEDVRRLLQEMHRLLCQ